MRRGRTLGFRIGPSAPSPAPIRLMVPVAFRFYPERQDAPCAPRSYGDGGPPDGGGVRRGFSVGSGLGVGEGEGVGSAVALGDGSTDGVGEVLGSVEGLGLTEGSLDAEDSADSVGAGVITGSGVADTTGLGRGVAFVEGSAVWAAGTEGLGVATGGMLARGPENTGSCPTTCEAANTNAPPSSVTERMVTRRVPVVRIAPRITCVRRSDSHERWARRRARSSSAAMRIRSSRSGVGRMTDREPSRPRTRVLLPISAVQAAQVLTWAARRAASAAPRSSSRNASMRARARVQSRAWPTCGFVTSHT